MPIPAEFRRHLHDVMIETMLRLQEELNQHQRELVFQARQAHNAAAIPNAYSKAAIHAFRTRIETVTDRFMDAIKNCGIEVDDAVEKEVLSSIGSLTSAKPQLLFPPEVMRQPNISAVQSAHAMELGRTGSLLYRQAANRLREAKIKAKQTSTASDTSMSQSKPVAEGKSTTSGKAVSTDVPTAFMSYSWDGPEHKDWVLRLAQRLRGNGVDVILDQWNLPLGGDRTYFMENSARMSDFVLLVCTPNYAQKSNARTGGVGYEATILTGQLAQQITQNKFIPVLRSGDWDDTAIPIWLQTKIGVDLRDDPINEEQYQLLVTALHNEQVKAPPVGPKPSFLPLPPSHLQSEGIMENAVSAALAPVGTDTVMKTIAGSSSHPKLSPEAYAFYEKKGSNTRMQVYIRPVEGSPDRYSLETSTGDVQEGTLKEISLLYLTKDYELKSEGYSRMQSFNGTSGQRFNLPQ